MDTYSAMMWSDKSMVLTQNFHNGQSCSYYLLTYCCAYQGIKYHVFLSFRLGDFHFWTSKQIIVDIIVFEQGYSRFSALWLTMFFDLDLCTTNSKFNTTFFSSRALYVITMDLKWKTCFRCRVWDLIYGVPQTYCINHIVITI